MELLDLGSHGDAQLGVEVRERFVEQEDLGIAHDGAAHGDALALAARQLSRIALQQRLEAENVGGLRDSLLDLGLVGLSQLQRKAHVVVDGHVWIERIVLKDHGYIALFRRHVVDDAPADRDLAARDILETGDHAQQRGFAAARRADQHHEFAVLDIDIDAMDDRRRSIGLAHVPNINRRHTRLPPRRLIAPKRSWFMPLLAAAGPLAHDAGDAVKCKHANARPM